MHVMYKVLIAVFLLGFIGSAQANPVEKKGMATITIKKKKPSAQERDKGMAGAKINAIERYIASSNNANQRNYDLFKNEIITNIDNYVLSSIILDESVDKEALRYTVVIRAEINTSRLENTLQKNTAVGNATDFEKSYLTFVFISRQQSSVKKYDARVVKRQDTKQSEDGSDSESISGGNLQYQSNNNNSQKVVQGGSTTRKADVVEYQVASSSEVNSIMSRVFTENGFEVVEAEYLEEETGGLLTVAQFASDFSSANDITGKTKRNAVKGIQMVDVPYLAVGTLDIGLDDIDTATGLARVYVSVSGKVISGKGRFPKTIASVGPIQFAGTGPNSTVAQNNALILAAEKAAKQLSDQLHAKGIK